MKRASSEPGLSVHPVADNRVETVGSAVLSGPTDLVNACLEGADVVSETNVPTSYSTLFDRVDQAIRPGSALIAVAIPRNNPMKDAEFVVFECKLIKQIDLVARAKELGLLEPFETPVPYWPSQPRG